MSILISNRGESPPGVSFYNDSKVHTKNNLLEKPEAFVFSHGNYSLLSHKKLQMAAPMFHYSDVTYNSSDDEGSIEEDEVRPPVDDVAVELFVKRVILASVINKEGEESFGIDDPSDGSLNDMDFDNRPKRVLPTVDKQEWKKKMRKTRKNSDGRKEKMPVPEVIGPHGLHLPLGTIRGYTPDGNEIVTMPMDIYRETVLAEVDSIARRLYHYFSDELKYFDNMRVDALKDSFFWHEKTKLLEKVIEAKETENLILREEKAAVVSQIEGEKMLKRQRRADKKQRRKEKTSLSEADTRQEAGPDTPTETTN